MQFSDLECPFCRRFHLALRSAQADLDVPVRSVFIHYPLPQHRFAIPAARGSECAREQGRFDEFIDAIFSKQDSLGLRSWVSYARDAAVSDTSAFGSCIARSDVPLRVEQGRTSGDELHVSGTPTVIINGWRYPVPPYEGLTKVLEAAASDATRRR